MSDWRRGGEGGRSCDEESSNRALLLKLELANPVREAKEVNAGDNSIEVTAMLVSLASACRIRLQQGNGAPAAALAVRQWAGYIAGELADWLQDRGMDHTGGAPCHPQTQGKIER